MRRADHPHVHGNRMCPAQPLDGPVFEYAQHFGLRHRVHVANFVQKNRSARCQLELAFFLLGCAGKRSALVAKQFRFNQRFRQRRAIHRHVRLPRARRPRMNFLRQQIFPRPAFPENQHRRVRWRHAIRHLERPAHFRRAPNHLPKLAVRGHAAAQCVVFLFKCRKLHQIVHALPQFVQFESFYKVIRCAKLQRLDRRFCRVQRRYHEHRQFASLLPHPLQERQPILPRQHDVQQQQIRLLARQRLAGGFRRIRFRDPILCFERLAQPVSGCRFIIHN